MRFAAFALLCLSVSACTASEADDASVTSGDSNLNEATSFTTCGPYGALANVVYSADGKQAAFFRCPAAAGDKGVLERIDLATHAITDVATFDRLEFVKTSDGGKHFYVLDDATKTLHLYAWDGSPELSVADATGFVLSPDGKRIVTYTEKRLPVGMYKNLYHLEVRVRSFDGTLDATGTFEEDRAGNYVNGDANVRGVVFAPDGSHVGLLRAYASSDVDVFVTKFDPTTKQFSDGTHFGWTMDVYPETYDGSQMAVTRAAYDGYRYFAYGKYSARLANVDPSSYLGVFCSASAGSGIVFLAQADSGQPVRLLRWDAAGGESEIASFASGAPEAPAGCPTVAPSGKMATYKSSSSSKPAVIALAPNSTPHVLDLKDPMSFFEMKLGDDRVLDFPTPDDAQLVDPVTGAATDVPFTAADGARLSSVYSALLPGNRIVAIGSKTGDKATVWTSTGGAFTLAATLGTDHGDYMTIARVGGDKGFAVEHEDRDGQHSITTVVP